MPEGTRLVIQELTGSQRSIQLAGWAGPERGPSFGVEMGSKKTTYPGNPRGTIDVLAPDWMPTTFEGKWIDRYLVNGSAVVQAEGFPDLASSPWPSTALVAAFYSLAISGNALRVSWYNEVREGILKRFVPSYGYPTGVDVSWSAEFEWQASDVAPSAGPVAGARQDPRSEMRQEMSRTDQAATRRPTTIPMARVAAVTGAQGSTRAAAGACFDAFRAIAAAQTTLTPSLTLPQPVASVVSTTGTLVSELDAEFRAIADPPAPLLVETDRAIDLYVMEAWRRDLVTAQVFLRNGALARARVAASLVSPGPVQLVTAAIGSSLRTLARRFYGSADAWQRIADANGITGSTLPRTMLIAIPPPGV